MSTDRWHEIPERAFTEARAGAPAGMVAFYVTVEVEHLRKGHEGDAQACGPCYYFADKFRVDFDAARRARIAPECSTGQPQIHADCDGCDCTCHTKAVG